MPKGKSETTKEEGHTTQWSKEEGHTTQWSKEEVQTTIFKTLHR
jgi:alpha-amylase/alpha-mannosidase (GH57 family)